METSNNSDIDQVIKKLSESKLSFLSLSEDQEMNNFDSGIAIYKEVKWETVMQVENNNDDSGQNKECKEKEDIFNNDLSKKDAMRTNDTGVNLNDPKDKKDLMRAKDIGVNLILKDDKKDAMRAKDIGVNLNLKDDKKDAMRAKDIGANLNLKDEHKDESNFMRDKNAGVAFNGVDLKDDFSQKEENDSDQGEVDVKGMDWETVLLLLESEGLLTEKEKNVILGA